MAAPPWLADRVGTLVGESALWLDPASPPETCRSVAQLGLAA